MLQFLFAKYGLPLKVVTDNGPQFTSEGIEILWRRIASSIYAVHLTIPLQTDMWNSLFKFKSVFFDKWKDLSTHSHPLTDFLLTYCFTPHETMNYSAHSFFNVKFVLCPHSFTQMFPTNYHMNKQIRLHFMTACQILLIWKKSKNNGLIFIQVVLNGFKNYTYTYWSFVIRGEDRLWHWMETTCGSFQGCHHHRRSPWYGLKFSKLNKKQSPMTILYFNLFMKSLILWFRFSQSYLKFQSYLSYLLSRSILYVLDVHQIFTETLNMFNMFFILVRKEYSNVVHHDLILISRDWLSTYT